MRRILTALLFAALAGPAMADGKPKADKAAKAKKDPPGLSASHCPPGLAKKDPPCVPPGQARKAAADYRIGDRIPDGWVLVPDPLAYGIPDPGTYWRVGDTIFRVDRETGEILAVLGALARLAD